MSCFDKYQNINSNESTPLFVIKCLQLKWSYAILVIRGSCCSLPLKGGSHGLLTN
jgi:hypothetical protein